MREVKVKPYLFIMNECLHGGVATTANLPGLSAVHFFTIPYPLRISSLVSVLLLAVFIYMGKEHMV